MRKNIIRLITIICAVFSAYYIFNRIEASETHTGTVIVLNGPSGSGKSSIQREFQTLMMLQPTHEASADAANLWIQLGIDNLFDKPMPDITLENLAFWQTENPIRWVTTTKNEEGKSIVTLFTGEQGEKVAYGMNSAIAGYAQAGCDCIVDYIAYKTAWVDNLHRKLKNTKTYWIKIHLPLDVLEEREQARGTSPVGHARSHYDTVYGDIAYDLELDTSKLTAAQCAQKIKEFIESKK